MLSLLDNPIWNALLTRDSNKNIGSNGLAFFDEEVAPFMGMASWDEKSQRELLQQAPLNRRWYLLIADPVKFIKEVEVVLSIPLYQCYSPDPVKQHHKNKDNGFIVLLPEHADEMIALAEMTKPGPFRKRTIEFGNYHGIFEDGKLVAMGGERLHINRFTEVSAICTHPDYQGRGFGAKIVRHLRSLILEKEEIPFLHARIDNQKALDLYKREGFVIRREVQFYIFKAATVSRDV